jgi:hypothetical protein
MAKKINTFFRSDIFGGLSTDCLLSPSASDIHATHSVRREIKPFHHTLSFQVEKVTGGGARSSFGVTGKTSLSRD